MRFRGWLISLTFHPEGTSTATVRPNAYAAFQASEALDHPLLIDGKLTRSGLPRNDCEQTVMVTGELVVADIPED